MPSRSLEVLRSDRHALVARRCDARGVGRYPGRSAPTLTLLLALAAPFGCTGVIESPKSPDGAPGPQAPGAFACDDSASVDPGPSPLLRLTREQYIATASDIFGTTVDLDALLPPEGSAGHIGLGQPDVSQVVVESYGTAASALASHVAANLGDFAPCDDSGTLASARACATRFVDTVGTRIYRRPVTDDERPGLTGLFDLGFEGGGYAGGIELLVRGMLSSPAFLYRPEFGVQSEANATAVPLSGYEMATRLSFAFWNRGPDQELLDQAASGALDTAEGVANQAARLMADPRAKDSFRSFLAVWFGLVDFDTVEKSADLFPDWTSSVREAQLAEGQAFIDAVLFGADGSLAALFGRPTGDGDRTPGLFGLPALLSAHAKPDESFPIYRGLFVREQILCQQLPAPPADIPELEPRQGGVTGRERLEQHTSDERCAVCHDMIDPLGLAFENYDAVGAFRTHEEGQLIDPSGVLTGTDVDGPFADLDELSTLLSGSDTVRTCVTRQWFRYVMQRFEQRDDGCSMQRLYDAFARADYRFDALREAIVQTPAFRMRRPIN